MENSCARGDPGLEIQDHLGSAFFDDPVARPLEVRHQRDEETHRQRRGGGLEPELSSQYEVDARHAQGTEGEEDHRLLQALPNQRREKDGYDSSGQDKPEHRSSQPKEKSDADDQGGRQAKYPCRERMFLF